MITVIKTKAFFGVLGGISIIRFFQFVYFKNNDFGGFAAAYALESVNNTFGLPYGLLDNFVSVLLLASAGLAFAGLADKLRENNLNRLLFPLLGLNSFILFLYVLERLTPEFDVVVALICLPVFFFPPWGYLAFGFYGGSDIFFLFVTSLVQIFLLVAVVANFMERKKPANLLLPSGLHTTMSSAPITRGVSKMNSNTLQWTVRIPGQPENPVDTATLQSWAKSGFIKADTMVNEVATGYSYQARQIPNVFSSKSYVTALLLSFFFGVFGVDRFYLGHVGVGLGKLFTFGGLGIWALIDFVLIATKNVKDSQGAPLA